MSSAVTPAASCTDRISSACAFALGAVMPLVRPSPLTPPARITARTWSPSRSAASNGLSSTTPTPSPSTIPSASASASNGMLRPVGDSMPALLVRMCRRGVVMTATPPASALSHSPRRMLSHARCTAVSEDEHAVSTAIVGPRRSSR